MITEQDAQRIAMIFAETTGQHISERLKRVHAAVPHATEEDIKGVLKTQHETSQLDATDAAVEGAAVQKMVLLLDRAQQMSGNRNMDTGEAIAFSPNLLKAVAWRLKNSLSQSTTRVSETPSKRRLA